MSCSAALSKTSNHLDVCSGLHSTRSGTKHAYTELNKPKMRYLPIIATLLPLLLAITRAEDNESVCPPGFEVAEVPPGTGNFVCRKISIDCPGGSNRKYVDETTGTHLCCPVGQELVVYDQTTSAGVCCGEGQVYAGTPPDGKCVPKTGDA
ncbi:hypothetical protein PM082_021750 [Marasmius tenuissimus]|nr:hypothetical protein PM082_021750 [Marasmius tenuissimus]